MCIRDSIDCTCLILAHHSLTRLRCPVLSWLENRRLQASKTSDKHPQLQLYAHMSWPFQFQNYVPGPRYQVLAINPICHDPHRLVDFFLTPNLCHICVPGIDFPRRVMRMCILQQPVYIHYIFLQDLFILNSMWYTKHRGRYNRTIGSSVLPAEHIYTVSFV